MTDLGDLPDTPIPTTRADVDVEGVAQEPQGIRDLRDSASTVSAATTGAVPDEPIDEARLRLRDAQTALVALGYEIQTDESKHHAWGPETREVIARFQRDRDLPETGQLDLETYQALLAEYEVAIEVAASPEPENQG